MKKCNRFCLLICEQNLLWLSGELMTSSSSFDFFLDGWDESLSKVAGDLFSEPGLNGQA